MTEPDDTARPLYVTLPDNDPVPSQPVTVAVAARKKTSRARFMAQRPETELLGKLDRFAAGAGPETPPDDRIDRVIDAVDRAVDHQEIHALDVKAPEIIHVSHRAVRRVRRHVGSVAGMAQAEDGRPLRPETVGVRHL